MFTFLLIVAAASLALLTYLRLEPPGERRWIPMLFRAVAWAGLGALLANPGCPGPLDSRPPLVLLDASLSVAANPAVAQAAGDTARALGPVRWFGDPRPWTDSVAHRGRSELRPTLASAVALGRRTVVVTDGELDDLADIPADLLAAAGFVVVPRSPGRDLGVIDVRTQARATVGDTIAVTAELRLAGAESPDSVTVVVRDGARILGRARTVVPPGAAVSVRVNAATRGLAVGTKFLSLEIDGAADVEPRNDARLVAVDLSGTPGIVLLASPGDWDARFLYRALREVADLPVKGFVRLAGGRWHDMEGLGAVSPASVRAAASGADLLVVHGESSGMLEGARARGVLLWPGMGASDGEWYAAAAPGSPIAFAFLGVPMDSLPPLSGVSALSPVAGEWIGLTVQVGRRGAARPVIVGRQAGRRREVTVAATGLWRWGFRGGPSSDAYRAMVAAAVSWLLAEPDRGSTEARLLQRVVAQGMPLVFERADDSTLVLPVAFEGGGRVTEDTLRFGGDGRASVWLAPGTYRYRFTGPRGGTGLAAIDEWSREWMVRPAAVASRPVPAAGAGDRRTLRQLPWVYLLVLLALGGEWLARRRLGLR